MEKWRIVKEKPEWEISNLGNIRVREAYGTGKGKQIGDKIKFQLVGSKNKKRLGTVTVSSNPETKPYRIMIFVHRMMANNWMPPKPSPQHCIHFKNWDTLNCKLTNLQWMTFKDILKHNDKKYKKDLKPKLQIIEILRKEGKSWSEIAIRMNTKNIYRLLHRAENHGFKVEKRKSFKKSSTHCSNGHEYTEDNVYYYQDMRRCRICHRAAMARENQRRRALRHEQLL